MSVPEVPPSTGRADRQDAAHVRRAGQQPDDDRAARLRLALVRAATRLADAEENTARVYTSLAEGIVARRSGKSAEYRQTAEQARQGAQRAREIADRFARDPDG